MGRRRVTDVVGHIFQVPVRQLDPRVLAWAVYE